MEEQQLEAIDSQINRRKFMKGAGLFTITSLAGGTFLLGCTNDASTVAPAPSPTPGTPAAPAPAPRKLRNLVYVTPFQHIISHADVYVAIQEGYFEEEGLLITPIGGQGTATSVQQVAARQGIFGKGASVITLPLVANGTADLITVAQKDQRGQYKVASDPSAPLKTPQDLIGKTIGVISLGGTARLSLDAMLLAAGVPLDSVNRVVTGADAASLEFLRRGEVDGFFTFTGTETTFNLLGINLNYLPTSDYAELPEDSYFVTKQTAEDEPEAIVSFLRGCRRGWEFMAEPSNAPKVLTAIGAWNPTEVEDEARAVAIVNAEMELVTPDDSSKKVLDINLPAWEKGIELCKGLELIAEDVNLPLSDYVTTEFIDQV